jgi:hypothetical protein
MCRFCDCRAGHGARAYFRANYLELFLLTSPHHLRFFPTEVLRTLIRFRPVGSRESRVRALADLVAHHVSSWQNWPCFWVDITSSSSRCQTWAHIHFHCLFAYKVKEAEAVRSCSKHRWREHQHLQCMLFFQYLLCFLS